MTREEWEERIRELDAAYCAAFRERGAQPGSMTRAFYRRNGGTEDYFDGRSFDEVKRDVLGVSGTTRENVGPIEIKERPQRYFVTAAVAGQQANVKALEAVRRWEQETGGRLIVLSMRGAYPSLPYAREIADCANALGPEYDFKNHEHLHAVDFFQYPRNFNPLQSLERLGAKERSLIVAHPKQFMRFTIRPPGKVPHGLWSTGAITTAGSYGRVESGALASEDHVDGGLIVEVQDRKRFYVRQAQFDADGGFMDLATYYHAGGVEQRRARIMKLSDLHSGWTDDAARAATWEQIKLLQPQRIRIGDAFDATSVTHHNDDNYVPRLQRPEHLRTLRAELATYVAELERWAKEFPDLDKVIDWSNHDLHLIDILNSNPSRWAPWIPDDDRLILHEMVGVLADDQNPLEWWARKSGADLSGWRWARRRESDVIDGCHWEPHGHEAGGGVRKPNAAALERSYIACVIGHVHSSYVMRRVRAAGTMAFKMPYAADLPSNALCSNVGYFDGGHYCHYNCIPDGKKTRWRL